MTTPQMTRSRISTVLARLTAAVVLVAVAATSCGSSVTSIAETTSPQPSPLDTSLLQPVPVESVGPITASGHQYGATIEEWTEVAREDQTGASEDSTDRHRDGYSAIEWADLIPPGSSGEEIMARFEQQLDEVEYGTAEAEELYEEIRAEFDPEAVNTELDGQQIRLAGFVAPLTYDDDIVTEFLLVPTFGACVHVPPPPPNQTIFVSVDKADGLTVDESWGAVWVEGTIAIEAATTDLAAASYKISDATSGVYNDV